MVHVPPKPPAAHAVVAEELTDDCPLCLKSPCDAKLHPCGHVAHWDCQGSNSLTNVSKCPLCRATITDFYNLSADQKTWNYDG